MLYESRIKYRYSFFHIFYRFSKMLQKQRHRESRQSKNDGGPLHGHEEESHVP